MSLLVLTRRVGEKIDVQIGGVHVEIMVARIGGGGQVHIAFVAPSSVTINRREITERINAGVPRDPSGVAADAASLKPMP